MREIQNKFLRSAKVGWALLWILGVPLPVLLAIYVLRGCQ